MPEMACALRPRSAGGQPKMASHKLFAGCGGLVRPIVARACAFFSACLRFGGDFLWCHAGSFFADVAICRDRVAVRRMEHTFIAGLAARDAFVAAERFTGERL